MKSSLPIWVALGLNFVVAAYAVYDAIAPEEYKRLVAIAPGLSIPIAIIGFSLAAFLFSSSLEAKARQREYRSSFSLLESLAKKGSLCMAVHESMFYSMWPGHLQSAEHNVDIAHLGPRTPNRKQSATEDHYFDNFAKTVKASKAIVRRVERLTKDKVQWIDKLVESLRRGAHRFSLAVYVDPLQDQEMPAAISVSRIDNKYGWMVALAEQHSTMGCRDLLVCDPDGVGLLAMYFEHRLWRRSVKIIDRGEYLEEQWMELSREYREGVR